MNDFGNDNETVDPGQSLARFASGVQYDDIPEPVVRRCEDLLLDWVASALAGKGGPPVETLTNFHLSMGPDNGPSEVLIRRRGSSPLAAAMSNAAASHYVEQDDLHNASVFHPATVVFPPALAVAQALGCSGRDFLTACVAGYEVGIRVGQFLGRSHYRTFHTTGTAGSVAAAAAVGRLLGLDATQMQHAFGSAGTQAAGLWEFLRDAADSKQLHTAHAAGTGLTAAYLARDGFTGAKRIFDGPQGMAAGMSSDAQPEMLRDRLASRWALAETSFKHHASCRHTHPAADALLAVMREHDLRAGDIRKVVVGVHQAAIDVLGPVTNPQTVHQGKFSMGTVLGLVALHGSADLHDFDTHYRSQPVVAFSDRVEMRLDAEVDEAYPARWVGKLQVETNDGRELLGRADVPKGDPGNTLDRGELERKAMQLGRYRDGASEVEMCHLIQRIWSVADAPVMTSLLPSG